MSSYSSSFNIYNPVKDPPLPPQQQKIIITKTINPFIISSRTSSSSSSSSTSSTSSYSIRSPSSTNSVLVTLGIGIGISLLITCLITYIIHWRRSFSDKKKNDSATITESEAHFTSVESIYHSPKFPSQLSKGTPTPEHLNIPTTWEGKQKRRSKADRPAWVVALSVTGALLLLSMIFDTGTISPNSSSSLIQVCPTLRYFSTMTLGFSLWISLVLYKLIRKYFQARLLKWKEAPSAIKTITILMVLPCLITITAMITSSFEDLQDQRNEVGVCEMNSPTFMILYLVMWILYFFIAIYLGIKIRKTIGEHHELYRYGIFLMTSFIVIFTYFIIQMSSLASLEGAQQTLLSMSIIMVTTNMGHIFSLIYKAAFSKTPLDSGDDDTDSERGRDDIDTSDPLEDANNNNGTIIALPFSFQEAKRITSQNVRPNFNDYLIRAANDEDIGGEVGMIDRGLGFWNTPEVPDSSLKSGIDGVSQVLFIDPNIIERGQKYLNSRNK